MNFKLKALVAAVVMAAAVPAQATLTLPNTGNGSAVLVIVDQVANLTATFDTGTFYSNYNKIASAGALGTQGDYSLNLASDANYSATWSAFFANGGTLANAQWGFYAADNNGAGAGGQGFVASYTSGNIASQPSGPVGSATGAFNTVLTNIDFVSTIQTNLNTSANPGAALQGGTPAAVYTLGRGLNNQGQIALGSFDNTLGFQQYVLGATTVSQAGRLLALTGGPTFTLTSNGVFSYASGATAPIPEADTWAMAMLGIGFMGFVARRKQA